DGAVRPKPDAIYLRPQSLLESRADATRQHLAEASTAGLEGAILDDRAEVEPIARARQRDVEQTLRFLSFPGGRVFIGLGFEITDRHRWRAVAVGQHADR